MEKLLPLILSMSGPMNALARYAATAVGGALAARGYVDASGEQAVIGGLIALAPAVIGMMTSTATAKIAAATKLKQVRSIDLASGTTVTNPEQAVRATR